MEQSLITMLVDKGATGIAVLCLGVVVYLVNTFLKHITKKDERAEKVVDDFNKTVRDFHTVFVDLNKSQQRQADHSENIASVIRQSATALHESNKILAKHADCK